MTPVKRPIRHGVISSRRETSAHVSWITPRMIKTHPNVFRLVSTYRVSLTNALALPGAPMQ